MSAEEDGIVNRARRARLKAGLESLALWAKARAENEHDSDTTLTMLDRKAKDLREGVAKAGRHALDEFHKQTTPTQHEL